MLFNLLITAIIFSAGIRAQPIVPHIVLSLTDDQSGRSAHATVPANGDIFTIPELFSGSILDHDGHIAASSAQLVQFVENTFCIFSNGQVIIPINDKRTFIQFDGSEPIALVQLNEVTFQCEI